MSFINQKTMLNYQHFGKVLLLVKTILEILQNKYQLQGIIMTQLLSILSANRQLKIEKTKYQTETQNVLAKHLITDFQFQNDQVSFWFPGNLFQQNLQEDKNYAQYSLFGSLKTDGHVFTILISVMDENNQVIRGSSIQQKTNLIRLSFLLNSYSDFFQIKTNPMTGEICFSHSFLYQNISFPFALDQTLYSLKKDHTIFPLAFQFLEKTLNSQNQYLKFVQQRIGIQQIDLEESEDEEMDEQINSNFPAHVDYFMTDKRKLQQFSPPRSFIEETLQNKELAGGRLAKDPNAISKTNLNYKMLKFPLNLKYLKSQKQQNISDNDAIKQTITTSNLETLEIKILMDKTDRVFNQYRKCEKVARKFYLSFLKQYLILKGQENSNQFIYYISESTIDMRSFLQRNFLTMSTATRVKISFDIALICMICNEALKGFSVKISMDNLLVSKNLQVKLDRLCMNSQKMDEDTSKTIMKILFGNNIAIMNRSKKKIDCFIENLDSLSMIGPSLMSKLIKKSLLDMMETKFVESGKCSRRQNLLMGLQTVYEFYEKDYDLKESWGREQTLF